MTDIRGEIIVTIVSYFIAALFSLPNRNKLPIGTMRILIVKCYSAACEKFTDFMKNIYASHKRKHTGNWPHGVFVIS